MGGALLEARLASSPHAWADLYRRKMPMAGGMSNVNMNRTWAAECHPSPLVDYVRVAPTGPTVPLVLAVTTIGSKFNFTLTRRVGLVDDERAARLADCVIDRLTRFRSHRHC